MTTIRTPNKEEVRRRLDIGAYYHKHVPSLRNGNGEWEQGCCPFHDDKNPSFSVNVKTGGWRCYSGATCGSGDVFGFHMKLKDVDFKTALAELSGGVVSSNNNGKGKPKVVATHIYPSADGNTLYEKDRVEPAPNGKPKAFYFYHYSKDGTRQKGRGCEPVLYNLPEVAKAKNVFFVEGEGCANRANKCFTEHGIDFVATTLDTGSNSEWTNSYTKFAKGWEIVVICPDNNSAGEGYLETVGSGCEGAAGVVKVLRFEGLPDGGDIVDWLEICGNEEKLKGLIDNAPEYECEAEEGDIGKADLDLIPLQPYPLEVFPLSMIEIIERISDSLGVERKVIAGTMLTVVSSAIGNTVRVSPKHGYEVPIFIWLIIIADSGYGKSPAIGTLTRAVEKKQGKAYQKYSESLKRYGELLREAKKKKTIENIDEPILSHFFASDTTVEALGAIFNTTPKGILIHRDELSGLILGLNQYKGSKGDDKQKYLELFNCTPWKTDRKGRVTFVPNTGAAIIGGVQTAIMPRVFGEDAIDEGLLPRFLLQDTEYKPRKFQRQGIEPDDLKHWEDILEKCYEMPLSLNENGYIEPKVLILNGGAVDLFEAFHNSYTELIPFLSNNAKPFVAKLLTYCLKIAGILHTFECFTAGDTSIKSPINASAMEKAIKLTKYYAGQSMSALKLYRTDTEKKLNEVEARLLKVVFSLENEIEKGKLPLFRIRERLNADLPGPLHHNPKQIGAMLRKQGLETKRSTGGAYVLVWEKNKIEGLKSLVTNGKETVLETEKSVQLNQINELELV